MKSASALSSSKRKAKNNGEFGSSAEETR